MQQSKEKGRRRRRLLLFPLPLQGHINPMLHLATILHSQGGFSISIIHTNFNSPNPNQYPHFTFHSISDGLTESESSAADLIALLNKLNAQCVGPFRECLGRLISDDSSEEEPIGCLISDVLLHFARGVAEGLGIPTVVLRTGGVCSFLTFVAFPLLLEKGYLPVQDSQLEELVPELPPLRVKDLPTIDSSNPNALYQLVVTMVNEAKATSGLILNSFEELEKPELTRLRQEFHVPVFPIGPFHKYSLSSPSSLLAQDQSSIPWLDMQPPKSVVYASFGSIAALDETEFLEVARGLADSGQPFLWVVRPGLVRGSEWLEPLPSGFLEMLGGRGKIVKWAPQIEVLGHPSVGAFWTHNGWNSTMESICEGVPMICTPRFTDQMANARYVSHVWRVGVGLEGGMERGKIESAIRGLVVEEEEGREIRERVLDLKEKANVCLKEGGSSYNSLKGLIELINSL